jgi:uncharacterized protein YidB (DUF937 family)
MFDGLVQQVKNELGGTGDHHAGIAASLASQLTSGGGAGLAGLVQQFTSSGLGSQVASWVGNGSNLPVSPQQIEQVMGSDRIRQLAAEHGIDPQQVSSQLARILPALVDKLTPNGQVAQGPSALDGLKGLFGGSGQAND